MFQTYTHIQRRRGRDGSSRLEYLQALVNEYKEASRQDVKRKVLANLSNFAYDPINYEWLYQLDTAKLFIDAVYNLDDDAQLQRIGVFGLCNYALGMPLFLWCYME
ncbi:Armadillo repeat-containing protein 7 [Umbelopsis nana]